MLHENNLLTLLNGDRINFGSNIILIFETHEIRYALPATIIAQLVFNRGGMEDFLSRQILSSGSLSTSLALRACKTTRCSSLRQQISLPSTQEAKSELALTSTTISTSRLLSRASVQQSGVKLLRVEFRTLHRSAREVINDWQ